MGPSYSQIVLVRVPKQAELLSPFIGQENIYGHVNPQHFLVQAWSQPTMRCDWWIQGHLDHRCLGSFDVRQAGGGLVQVMCVVSL